MSQPALTKFAVLFYIFLGLSPALGNSPSQDLIEKIRPFRPIGATLIAGHQELVALEYQLDDSYSMIWAGDPDAAHRMSFQIALIYRLPQGEWEVPQKDGSKKKQKYSAVQALILKGSANPRREPNGLKSYHSLELRNVGFVADGQRPVIKPVWE